MDLDGLWPADQSPSNNRYLPFRSGRGPAATQRVACPRTPLHLFFCAGVATTPARRTLFALAKRSAIAEWPDHRSRFIQPADTYRLESTAPEKGQAIKLGYKFGILGRQSKYIFSYRVYTPQGLRTGQLFVAEIRQFDGTAYPRTIKRLWLHPLAPSFSFPSLNKEDNIHHKALSHKGYPQSYALTT